MSNRNVLIKCTSHLATNGTILLNKIYYDTFKLIFLVFRVIFESFCSTNTSAWMEPELKSLHQSDAEQMETAGNRYLSKMDWPEVRPDLYEALKWILFGGLLATNTIDYCQSSIVHTAHCQIITSCSCIAQTGGRGGGFGQTGRIRLPGF